MSETPSGPTTKATAREGLYAAEPRVSALEARITELEAALQRMAAYLGVAHTLKDPRV